MKKNRAAYFLLLGLISACALSIWQNQHTALDALLSRIDPFRRSSEIEAIKRTVQYYNQYASLFYNTGGSVKGLNEIPAAPLLKRRLFKDITMLKRDGLVMVFDRDREEIMKVHLTSPGNAVAESKEIWFINLQTYSSRKPVSTVKAVQVQARYQLRKEPRGWIVYDTTVYPESEPIPPLSEGPAL